MAADGVQAAGTMPDGPGFTIADGVAVKKPGELTSSILDRVLDDIVSVQVDWEVNAVAVNTRLAPELFDPEALKRGR